MKTTVVKEIASLCVAIKNCRQSKNTEWEQKHTEKLEAIAKQYLPHGSGFDRGVEIDIDKTNFSAVYLSTSFHHMDEYGGYDGWTDHAIKVVPSFLGDIDITIKGRDRNGWKEYAYDVFNHALTQEYEVKQS